MHEVCCSEKPKTQVCCKYGPADFCLDDMATSGMTWHAHVLDTQDFLLSQRRTRAWAVGTREEAELVDFLSLDGPHGRR